MADPSFLSDVLMISGVDASYAPTYGNGQINYGNNYYFNSNHNINSNIGFTLEIKVVQGNRSLEGCS